MNKYLCALLAAGLLAAAQARAQPDENSVSIAAVVNGQVITDGDVAARTRLFALSTGLPLNTDTVARLRPQITSQLIDQTLEVQEVNRRGIIVKEEDIEGAVSHIEQGNNLPPGSLRIRMAAASVPFSTLILQLRAQLGWQDVLHQVLGPNLRPTAGDLNAQKKALLAAQGATQYHLAEIFIPVPDPAQEAAAQNFAATVIKQLRAGAPFPIIAAQFSQSQSALTGGDLGFLSANQLDPATAAVVTAMPTGAISNPIRVPGGYDIVQLQEERQPGAQMQTTLTLREAFVGFPAVIGPAGPTPQDIALIQKLVATTRGLHDCDAMAAANASLGGQRPADPGQVNLADVTPPKFQALLAGLPLNQPSEPLLAQDGASVVMVCDRQTGAAGLPSDDQIAEMIIDRRVDLESQQLLAALHHQSIIAR